MKWFSNMNIGTKLVISFIIVALIAGIVGIVGISSINNIAELDNEMYTLMTQPLEDAIIFVESYQRVRSNIRDIILTDDLAVIADYENRIKERNIEFDNAIVKFEERLFSDEGKQLTVELRRSKQQYDDLIEETIALAKLNQDDEAYELLIGSDAQRIISSMESAYRRLVEIKVVNAADTADANSRAAARATITMLAIAAGGVLLSIMLGIFISRIIKRPIIKLLELSREMADGNLDVHIDIDSKDEVGNLANAFNIMVNNTNDVMTNIRAASEQVAAGAKQVSDSSIDLSQGAAEQASAVEELTASLEEISSQTELNAENANELNKLAGVIDENALQGNVKMKDMLIAMDEINDSSSNISKIIKVIDEIAFQTNILALNAAVEAARAGQHGKGFAVVAEEVRNLAARSANAAKETTDMIEGSIKKTEDGMKIANETAAALNEIVEGVTKVANLVNSIAAASNEQAAGIEEVNQGIVQVSDVVQTNSATSEESAAASEELASQAQLLQEQVSRFKLKINGYSSAYNGAGEISPEVSKMLDSMQYNKKSAQVKQDHEDMAANNTKKIVLSDKEFGKY